MLVLSVSMQAFGQATVTKQTEPTAPDVTTLASTKENPEVSQLAIKTAETTYYYDIKDIDRVTIDKHKGLVLVWKGDKHDDYRASAKSISYKIIKNGKYIGALDEATSDYLGKIVTSDGFVYNSKAKAEADGKTPCGIIAYIGSDTGNSTYNHGLVIALNDVPGGSMVLSDALTAASNYNVACPRQCSGWHLPEVKEWNNMLTAFGSTPSDFGEYFPFGRKWPCDNIIKRLVSLGASNFQNDHYWSSSLQNGFNLQFWILAERWDNWGDQNKFYARAFFAF